MFFLTKTPNLLKKLYPKELVWNKSRSEKVIYLTFDDGPIPIVTPWVLKTLKSYNAKATFFCIGDNIVKHPDIFEMLKREGHAIGNHTFNHLKGWKTDDKRYLENFIKCQHLTQTALFRPPYGRIKFSQIRNILSLNGRKNGIENYAHTQKNKNVLPSSNLLDINMPVSSIIMWDVLSGDFDTKLNPERCLKNTLKYTGNGSIVVFHDSLKAWKRLEFVLPRALEVWSKAGFQFATL